ncbi:MAG: hypothetical protein AAGM22_06040 [Acidobacteriota bacterium]
MDDFLLMDGDSAHNAEMRKETSESLVMREGYFAVGDVDDVVF